MDISNTPSPAVHEHPLQVSYHLTSLEDLATTSLALDLWYHNQSRNFSMPPSIYTVVNFNCRKVLNVSPPQCITKTIDRRIRSVGRELQALYYCFARIGIIQNNCTFLKYFRNITYGPDGELCAEQTAKNILTRDELSHWQKFQIACVYWFEDEIRQIWPSVSNHPSPEKCDIFVTFVRYWMAKMRNSGNGPFPSAVNYPFEKMFSAAQLLGNWKAGVNVLNKLTPEQQYICIRSFARIANSGIKNVLPKLNEIQVDYILSKFPDQLIIGLALQKGGFEYAIKIWNLARNNIEFKTFFTIFKSLRRRAYDGDTYKHILPIRTQVQAVLLELWNTAPNRLKMEFFNNDNYVKRLLSYLHETNTRNFHHLDDDINFISKMYSDLPTEMRSTIWSKHWCQIVYFSSHRMFDRLLILGLSNSNYSEFVEKEIMNYPKAGFIIRRWMKLGLYKEVINYTKLCSWNKQLVREFWKEIFSGSSFSNFDDLIKMSAVIDESLSNDEAKETKRTILVSKDVQKLFKLKFKNGLAKEAIDVVDGLLSTERSEREKQEFLDYWRKFLTLCVDSPSFDERWNEFLSWWIDNKDDLPIFKQFLSEDENFEELLLQMMSTRLDALKMRISEPVPSLSNLQEFADVDEFLMWYFGNEEAVKNYKRSKISNYQKNSRLNEYLLSIKDENIISRIIAWVFNYDEIEISQFEKAFCTKDLSNLLGYLV